MFIDYKYWYINRDDDGHITEVAIRPYLGNITTAPEFDTQQQKTVPVTRYRRLQRVNAGVIQNALKDMNVQIFNDASNNPTVVLRQEHFGKIKTDAELNQFCNSIIKKFGHTPVPEQT